MNEARLARLAEKARKLCLEHGDFRLSQGSRSRWKLEAPRLAAQPETAELVVHSLRAVLNERRIRTVIPVPTGGIPFAAQLVLAAWSQPESPIIAYGLHGIGQEKEPPPAGPAAVLEDVISTGRSAIAVVQAAEAKGVQVGLIISILERTDQPKDESLSRIPRISLLEAGETPEGTVRIRPADAAR